MSELLRVTVTAAADEAEAIAATLHELAPGGLEERVDGTGAELSVYLPAGSTAHVLARFPAATAEPVPAGWEDRWRSFHHGVEVAGLWIGPPWETPPPGLPAVVIDPGLAFGTGAHPTTRLCVELLTRQPLGSLLDVGCGSGVLAIAAARLGHVPVVAVDVDPVAVAVTAENALVNEVVLETRVLDGTRAGLPAADLALANVLLAPVAAILAGLRGRAARVITSGYLVGERPDAPGWVPTDRLELDGWAADVFVRP